MKNILLRKLAINLIPLLVTVVIFASISVASGAAPWPKCWKMCGTS